jgi:hypothetical protein
MGDPFDQLIVDVNRSRLNAVRCNDVAAADDHVPIIAEEVVAVTAPVR